MDFVNKLTGGGSKQEGQSQATTGTSTDTANTNIDANSGGGGFMDKLNGMAGGGAQGEQNEDALDKGVDWVQENVLGQGAQNNESAVEQAKDEQISDAIRGQYKNMTGSDFPIKDKERF